MCYISLPKPCMYLYCPPYVLHFSTKTCMYLYCPPYVLHSPPISSFSILSPNIIG
jgi:hypothetical protein